MHSIKLCILFAIYFSSYKMVTCHDVQKSTGSCRLTNNPSPKNASFDILSSTRNFTAFVSETFNSSAFGKLESELLLYVDHFSEAVSVLSSDNFRHVVGQPGEATFVLFFSKNCHGVYCLMDDNTWKHLADSIHNWRKLIVLGIVNCDDEKNKKLCTEYRSWKNRTVQYFRPDQSNYFHGESFYPVELKRLPLSPDPKHSMETIWRNEITHQIYNLNPREKRPPQWPVASGVESIPQIESIRRSNNYVFDPESWLFNLFKCLLVKEEPFSTNDFSFDSLAIHIVSIWNSMNNSQLLILVLDEGNSYVGKELAMDLYDSSVAVRYTTNRRVLKEYADVGKPLPQIVAFAPSGTPERIPLWITTRSGVFFIVRNYLRKKGHVLLGKEVDCRKFVIFSELQIFAKTIKTHELTDDDTDLVICMQQKMLRGIIERFYMREKYKP